jgi:hypothetical protein
MSTTPHIQLPVDCDLASNRLRGDSVIALHFGAAGEPAGMLTLPVGDAERIAIQILREVKRQTRAAGLGRRSELPAAATVTQTTATPGPANCMEETTGE